MDQHFIEGDIMAIDIEQNAALEQQAEKPRGRARRVISERTAARRVRVLDQLKNPMVVAEDVDLLTDQANSIYLAFKPRNGWQDWLTSEIAVIMVRINRCARIERKLRDWASYRAIDFWEDDQKLEVENLAVKLDRQPGRVVAKLRQSPAGCEWLLTRWRLLARTAPTEWTDAQRSLARNLMGEASVTDPTVPGFAAAQVVDLEAQRLRVEEADEILRGLVEADLSDAGVPGLAGLRRYSRSLYRQMRWLIDQFHVEHPDRWDDPSRQPAFIAHEILDRDRQRKSTWSFADRDGESAKTKPTSNPDVADHSEVKQAPENDKTNGHDHQLLTPPHENGSDFRYSFFRARGSRPICLWCNEPVNEPGPAPTRPMSDPTLSPPTASGSTQSKLLHASGPSFGLDHPTLRRSTRGCSPFLLLRP